MNKKHRKYLIVCIVFFVLLLVCKYFIFGQSPKRWNRDLLQQTVVSPDETRVVYVYRHNGGATVDFAVTCDVSGRGLLPRRCIYWLYHAQNADVQWADNDHVIIDGIRIDVRGEWYHYTNSSVGGIGRDENGKLFLHKWWKE